MEITLKLTADPKLETLLDKLCNALDLGNGLPFTASQVAPAKPAAVTTVVPAATTTAARVVPVNPIPAGMTTAPTTAAAPVTTSAPTVATAPSPTVPVTTTVPVAAPAPVMTQPAPAANAVPPQTAVPTAAPAAYTIEQLQAAVGPLLMQGKGPQLQGLLAKYGVQRLPDMPADKMGLFAADLRGLGAQI